ncbi:hypothetical protein NFI96_031596, partial [Prochilodus magdalenae]
RITLPLMSKVKEELSRMESLQVISRVEELTDWCAGMVVVPKPDGMNLGDEQLEVETNLCVESVMSSLPASDERLEEIRRHQQKDDVLVQLKIFCTDGWPDKFSLDRAFQPYLQFAGELTVQHDLLLKGSQIVIP